MFAALIKRFPLYGGGALGRRLFWMSIGLMLAVTIISVLIELYIALNGRERIHEESLRKIVGTTEASIERALWEINAGTLESLAHSLTLRPEVKSVRISAGFMQIVEPKTSPLVRDSTKENCSKIISVDFRGRTPFGRPLEIGELTICMQRIPMSNAEWAAIAAAIVPRILSILLAALGVFAIFRKMILRRLDLMTARLKAAAPFTPGEQAAANNGADDELGLLYYELVHRTRYLEETRGLLEAAIETIMAGIVVTDQDMKILRINNKFDDLVGNEVPQQIGEKLRAPEALINACFAQTGEMVTFEHPNGRILEAVARPMKPAGHLIAVQDQTEKHRLYQQSIVNQKAEAISRLTSSIAHDFNNILAVIMGTAQIALRDTHLPEHVAKRLLTINEAGRSGAALTERLRSYTQNSPHQKVIVSPKAVIEKLLSFITPTLDANIRLESEIHSTQLLECHTEYLDAALLNLSINAIDAAQNTGVPGRIAITASDKTENGKPFVLFEIKDNGVGIPIENMSKIMAPFFTTKAHGTGLGLPMVSSFAAQSGGRLDIVSEVGRGTQVTLLLPGYAPNPSAFESKPSPQEPVGVAPSASTSGRPRVMVIDDNLRVRDIIAEMLVQAGYATVQVESLEHAVSAFTKSHFDAIVCDVNLVGATGMEVYKAISKCVQSGISPPFIFISGYVPDNIKSEIAALEDAICLDKPIQAGKLANAVKEMLLRHLALVRKQNAMRSP